MIYRSKNSAFSLVELLVAMAIIAVLISISVYGMKILQRNSRNTVRRTINQNVELAINDVSASNPANRVNWIGYNSASKQIELKNSSSDTIIFNSVPANEFTEVTIQTSTACSANNDSSGYGAPEIKANRLWICFNPTSQLHGVRIENGTLQEMVLSLGKMPINVGGKVYWNSGWTAESVSKIENVTDSDPYSYLAVNTNYGTQLTINLDNKQPISAIDYNIWWDTRFGSKANVIFYTSNDNVTWTALPTQTVSNYAGKTTFNVPSGTQAQYVKFVWATPPSGGWNGWGGISDISVK